MFFVSATGLFFQNERNPESDWAPKLLRLFHRKWPPSPVKLDKWSRKVKVISASEVCEFLRTRKAVRGNLETSGERLEKREGASIPSFDDFTPCCVRGTVKCFLHFCAIFASICSDKRAARIEVKWSGNHWKRTFPEVSPLKAHPVHLRRDRWMFISQREKRVMLKRRRKRLFGLSFRSVTRIQNQISFFFMFSWTLGLTVSGRWGSQCGKFFGFHLRIAVHQHQFPERKRFREKETLGNFRQWNVRMCLKREVEAGNDAQALLLVIRGYGHNTLQYPSCLRAQLASSKKRNGNTCKFHDAKPHWNHVAFSFPFSNSFTCPKTCCRKQTQWTPYHFCSELLFMSFSVFLSIFLKTAKTLKETQPAWQRNCKMTLAVAFWLLRSPPLSRPLVLPCLCSPCQVSLSSHLILTPKSRNKKGNKFLTNLKQIDFQVFVTCFLLQHSINLCAITWDFQNRKRSGSKILWNWLWKPLFGKMWSHKVRAFTRIFVLRQKKQDSNLIQICGAGKACFWPLRNLNSVCPNGIA